MAAKEGGEEESNNSNSNGKSIDLFNMLPEGCIADAVSHTSPVDACRLALVATSFRSAAESDLVWERFLPADVGDLLSRSCSNSNNSSFATKKELFLYLSDHPLIIDHGAKSFSLEKWSGKKCFMIAARKLSIVWGDTPRYWRWVSDAESRFAEVAELFTVCWLEIRGKINASMLSSNTAYAAYLVYKSTPDIYGFEHQPVEVSVGIRGNENESKIVYLDPEKEHHLRHFTAARRIGVTRSRLQRPRIQDNVIRENNGQYPKKRDDGWLEVEFGEYFNKEGEDRDVEMSLTEVKGGNWKSGLVIQGIEIRPKGGK